MELKIISIGWLLGIIGFGLLLYQSRKLFMVYKTLESRIKKLEIECNRILSQKTFIQTSAKPHPHSIGNTTGTQPILSNTPQKSNAPNSFHTPPQKHRKSFKISQLSYWLGALALSVGGFYFSAHLMEHRLLGPWSTFALGCAIGILLIVLSFLVLKHQSFERDRFAHILCAVGISVTYGNLYVAFLWSHILLLPAFFVSILLLGFFSIYVTQKMGPWVGMFTLFWAILGPFAFHHLDIAWGPQLLLLVFLNGLTLGHAQHPSGYRISWLLHTLSVLWCAYLHQTRGIKTLGMFNFVPILALLIVIYGRLQYIHSLVFKSPRQIGLHRLTLVIGMMAMYWIQKEHAWNPLNTLFYAGILISYGYTTRIPLMRRDLWIVGSGIGSILWVTSFSHIHTFIWAAGSIWGSIFVSGFLWGKTPLFQRAESIFWASALGGFLLYCGFLRFPEIITQWGWNIWSLWALIGSGILVIISYLPHRNDHHLHETLKGALPSALLFLIFATHLIKPGFLMIQTAGSIWILGIAARIYGWDLFNQGIIGFLIALGFLFGNEILTDTYYARILEMLFVPLGAPTQSSPAEGMIRLCFTFLFLLFTTHIFKKRRDFLQSILSSCTASYFAFLSFVGAYEVYQEFHRADPFSALWAARSLLGIGGLAAIALQERYHHASRSYHGLTATSWTLVFTVAWCLIPMNIWVYWVTQSWEMATPSPIHMGFWIGMNYTPLLLLPYIGRWMRIHIPTSIHAFAQQLGMLYAISLWVMVVFRDTYSDGGWTIMASERTQAMTIGWLFALAISIFWALRARVPQYFWGSRAIAYLLLLKVFALDTIHLEGLARVASFVTLGISLIVLNYLCNRYWMIPKPQNNP